MSLFESTITGNSLNDGQTTEISGITAGQLAAASAGGRAAPTAGPRARRPGRRPGRRPRLPSSQPVQPHGPDTTGLVGKANQSALDAGKSTPTSVDTKLQAYSTTIASAATYGLKSTQDQLARSSPGRTWTRRSPRRCCRTPTPRASARPWHFAPRRRTWTRSSPPPCLVTCRKCRARPTEPRRPACGPVCCATWSSPASWRGSPRSCGWSPSRFGKAMPTAGAFQRNQVDWKG